MPFSPTVDDPVYDVRSQVVGATSAPFNPVYKFSAVEGATYSVLDISFFDPYLRLYDASGNAVFVGSETVDNYAELMYRDMLHMPDGGRYSLDIALKWVAPYTGDFYLKPGWDQGIYYKSYGLSVSGDLDTAAPPPPPLPPISDTDRVFNWGETAYSYLFPEHQESRADVFGYYARLYSNGDAVGEKDGNVYYYDGGAGGTGDILLVGTVQDYLPQAVAAGF